jgi:hypothetical protein
MVRWWENPTPEQTGQAARAVAYYRHSAQEHSLHRGSVANQSRPRVGCHETVGARCQASDDGEVRLSPESRLRPSQTQVMCRRPESPGMMVV